MPRQLHPQLCLPPSRQHPGHLLGASQHKPRLLPSQQPLDSQRLLLLLLLLLPLVPLLQSPAQHLLHSSSSSTSRMLPSRPSRQHRQIKDSRRSRCRQQLPSQVGRCQTSLGSRRQQPRPSRSRERLGASLMTLLVFAPLQALVSSPMHGVSPRGKLNNPHRLSLKPSSNLSLNMHLKIQIPMPSRHSRLKGLLSLQASRSRQQRRHLLRPQQR